MRAAVQGGGCPWRPGASIGDGGGRSCVSRASPVFCASRVSRMSCVSFVPWLSYPSCVSRVHIVSCVSSVSCLSCVCRFCFMCRLVHRVSCRVPRGLCRFKGAPHGRRAPASVDSPMADARRQSLVPGKTTPRGRRAPASLDSAMADARRDQIMI